MNMWTALFNGFGFGIIIAAPVGPMSILCMNRTLSQGFRLGFATGLGIALADACYALLTISGFGFVSELIATHTLLLRLLGSMFLGYLGVKALCTGAVKVQQPDSSRLGLASGLGSAFLLTLANPATILTFLAFAATLATTGAGSLLLPAGILLGSCSWWLLLSSTLYGIGRNLHPSFTKVIHIFSSVLLILFSLYELSAALFWDRG